jgi:hypothetical protein
MKDPDSSNTPPGTEIPPEVWNQIQLTDTPATVDSEDDKKTESGRSLILSTKTFLIALVLFFAAGNIGYHFLVKMKLEQTAALFIGLPTIMCILMILTPPAKTATGAMLRGMTIALLMAGPLLGEGFICVLMASPIFLAVALMLGVAEDYTRHRRNKNKLRAVIWLPLLVMSLEGVSDKLSFSRDESVAITRNVPGSVEQCEQRLAQKPDFPAKLPFYLKLGFPRPKSTTGHGLQPGSTRTILFGGGEGKPGTLSMRVSEHTPGHVKFTAVKDTSHIAHWLDWQSAVVDMKPIGANETQVTWTLNFTRRLDPAWYFAPWQRYGAKLAAQYLIENLVAPQPAVAPAPAPESAG